MERVTVFTANIGRTEGQAGTRANIKKIYDGVKHLNAGYLIGFQEIDEADPGDEHQILQSMWKLNTISGFHTAVPQVIGRPVEVLGMPRVTKTCDGRAKVTPTRYCVQSKIEINGIAQPIMFLNGHYPFEAEDLRRDCNREWTRLVHEYVESGYPVITTRDSNWHGRMPKLHPRERLLTKAGAIDRITVVDSAKVTFRVAKRHSINLTIDGHNAEGLTLSVKERA